MRRSYESFCKRLKGSLCRYFELYLYIFFFTYQPLLLESIGPWVIGEKREIETFKTRKMSDEREICMREYDKKVVLCETEIGYASKV